MTLYYNNETNVFSLRNAEGFEPIFETYDREERKGWRAGLNPIIKVGPFEIIINSNFYPRESYREYLSVAISVDGVILLPLSKAIRKADVHYQIGEKQIAIKQYGIDNYRKRSQSTIVQQCNQIDWVSALTDVCNICNNYKQWIINETESFFVQYMNTGRSIRTDMNGLLKLVRMYDGIVPEIIPVYRKYLDSCCLDAMKASVLDVIDRVNTDGFVLNKPVKELIAERGDSIWQYIKDYYLAIEKKY